MKTVKRGILGLTSIAMMSGTAFAMAPAGIAHAATTGTIVSSSVCNAASPYTHGTGYCVEMPNGHLVWAGMYVDKQGNQFICIDYDYSGALNESVSTMKSTQGLINRYGTKIDQATIEDLSYLTTMYAKGTQTQIAALGFLAREALGDNTLFPKITAASGVKNATWGIPSTIYNEMVSMWNEANNYRGPYTVSLTGMPKTEVPGTSYTATATLKSAAGKTMRAGYWIKFTATNATITSISGTTSKSAGRTNANGQVTVTYVPNGKGPVTINATAISLAGQYANLMIPNNWKTNAATDTVAQRGLMATLQNASASASATLPVTYAPKVTTVTSSHLITGSTALTDTIKVTGGQPGKAFSGTSTLYGPFTTNPAQQATVPAGASAVGTAKYSGTFDANGNATVQSSAVTVTKAGYYVWVENLPAGSFQKGYTGQFGESTETSVYTTPTVHTQINDQSANPGQTISDTVTASGIVTKVGSYNVINTLSGYIDESTDGGKTWTKVSGTDFTKTLTANGSTSDLGSYTVPSTSTTGTEYSYVERLITFVDTNGDNKWERGENASTVNSTVGQTTETTKVQAPSPKITTHAAITGTTPGSLISDSVVVTGMAGTSGTVSVTAYGPVSPVNGSCANVNWSKAPVLGTLPSLTVTGDGTYKTAQIATSKTAVGCYTFVEKLTPTGSNTPTVTTTPGTPSETELTTPSPKVTTVASATTSTPGAKITDTVKVTGLEGQAATITGKMYGPVAPVNGSCAGISSATWLKAPSQNITALKVVGDGTYKTAALTAPSAGCYTFVESLTPTNYPTTVTNTSPGASSETVLLKTPVHYVTRTFQIDRDSWVNQTLANKIASVDNDGVFKYREMGWAWQTVAGHNGVTEKTQFVTITLPSTDTNAQWIAAINAKTTAAIGDVSTTAKTTTLPSKGSMTFAYVLGTGANAQNPWGAAHNVNQTFFARSTINGK